LERLHVRTLERLIGSINDFLPFWPQCSPVF